jgi:hypothetical protein
MDYANQQLHIRKSKQGNSRGGIGHATNRIVVDVVRGDKSHYASLGQNGASLAIFMHAEKCSP